MDSKTTLPEELAHYLPLVGQRVRYSINGNNKAARYGELLAVDSCAYPFTVRDGRSFYFCKSVC